MDIASRLQNKIDTAVYTIPAVVTALLDTCTIQAVVTAMLKTLEGNIKVNENP